MGISLITLDMHYVVVRRLDTFTEHAKKRVSSELKQKPRRLFCVWDTERRLTSHIELGIFV